jgi:hypothetical protein
MIDWVLIGLWLRLALYVGCFCAFVVIGYLQHRVNREWDRQGSQNPSEANNAPSGSLGKFRCGCVKFREARGHLKPVVIRKRFSLICHRAFDLLDVFYQCLGFAHKRGDAMPPN